MAMFMWERGEEPLAKVGFGKDLVGSGVWGGFGG